MPRRQCRFNESGASVIIGTLMLILVVVIGATAIGLMMSTATKEEMNRQSHQNAVKNENITILNVAFENNQSEWVGVQNSQNWSSVKLTLLNLNTNDVIVMGIAINDHYALNYTDKSRTDLDVLNRNIFNTTNASYLTIPATKSKDVYIDFVANATNDPTGLVDYSQAQYFDVKNHQKIKVLTSLTNFFEKTLKPPNPLYQMSIESENLGVAQRDVLVLDGSESTADNSIVIWNWKIFDGSYTIPAGNWSDTQNWTIHYQTFNGKKVRITSLSNEAYYKGSLTVTDNIGMTATSDYFAIPPDKQFNPPVKIDISNNTNIITANVYDLGGMPVGGITLSFICTNVVCNPLYQMTVAGSANTSIPFYGYENVTVKAVATDYTLQSKTLTI